MSGSGRKCSKWDSRDHPQFEDGNVQDDGWAGKAGRSFYRRESGHGWQSPELAGTNGSKWSALETNDMRSRHDLGFPSREPFPGSRGSHKNENIDKDSNRYVTDTMAWDGDGHYSTRMSPGLDEWRHQSHSQSPREGWNRSLRGKSRSKSRSRSRSRSRSWSRSPGRELRREPGFLDRSRSRSGASSQMSKDFTAGRCRSNQNYDDYWDRQRKGGSSKYSTPQDARDHPLRGGRSTNFCTDFVKGNCRRGASCKFEHHGASDGFGFGSENEFVREKDNDRRRRDTSTERGVGRESRRSNDIPCKFFAIGKCRNGKYCRFSHHTPEERASPDRKPSDRRALGHKSNDVERVWDSSKWSAMMPNAAKLTEDINENVGAPEPRSHTWSLNDRSGERLNNENKSCGDPTVHEAAKGNEKEALRLKADIGGTGMDHSESRPSEKWLDDMDIPDWNYNVQSSNHVDTHKQSATLDASGPVATIIQPIINEKSLFQPNQNLREDSAIALPYDDKSTAKRTVGSHPNLNISANIMPTQTFGQSAQHANAYPLSRLNATGQSRVVIPTESQRGILENLQHNIPSTEVKSVARPDFMDGKTSIVDPRIPPIEKMVSEQVNLTDLSASLVQLLGNGPQLPQLYAALNSKSSTGIPSLSNAEGSVLPVLSATIGPDQAIGSQRQYDPICDSTVSVKPEISNNPPGALPNATVQTSVSDAKSEAQLKSLKLSSFPNGPNGTDSLQVGSSAEQPDHKRESLCQLEPNTSCEVTKENNELGSGETKKVQKENEKVQESDQLEVVDKEGADDGKKSKDLKGIRAFKFSLVEFVKELLKPAWKEGQIGKDAYKTIVKKVVDKVTGTMQGPNIPQTQEKIDHYLSISKPKLTKLVQAYVEKNQKA